MQQVAAPRAADRPEATAADRLISSYTKNTHVLLCLRTSESETADFAPGTATWRTRRNICVVFLFWPIRSITCIWKHDVIHKTGSTQHIVFPSEEDRATVIVNIYRKFREIWTCGFWNFEKCEQTDKYNKQADIIQTRWLQNIAPITFTGVEVIATTNEQFGSQFEDYDADGRHEDETGARCV